MPDWDARLLRELQRPNRRGLVLRRRWEGSWVARAANIYVADLTPLRALYSLVRLLLKKLEESKRA